MTNQKQPYRIQEGGLTFRFLPGGDLYQACAGDIMINQLLPHPADGSLSQLYLRVHREEGIRAVPLLGIRSGSAVSRAGSRIIWKGEAEGIRYEVAFLLTADDVWFWDVKLGGSGQDVDIVYGQDVGLAHTGAVRSNEAYVSHYIDHSAFQDDKLGWIVCSRQNQPQGGVFPYLQQGSLTKAAGYSTDGFQFFGLSYKETDRPERLSAPHLANEVYQYEFAYTALQTEKTRLCGEARFVFYGLYRHDHPQRVSGPEFGEAVRSAWERAESAQTEEPAEFAGAALAADLGEPICGRDFTPEELERLYPNRRQEEREDGALLSFFTDTYEHIVLKEKERRVERPHGHILMSGGNDRMNEKVLASTSYMYGIFNSHVVVGNTNFNKLLSHSRNALNVAKTSGQRIYIRLDGRYRLLTMPSAFEIGFNYARWLYRLDADLITITNWTSADKPELSLSFASSEGKAYEFLVTNQLTMGVNEFDAPCRIEWAEDGSLAVSADASSLCTDYYPKLKYRLQLSGAAAKLHGDERLAAPTTEGAASLAVLELEPASSWTLTMQGLLDGDALPGGETAAEREISRYREFLATVMNGFRLEPGDGGEGELFKFNALAWWYTHNMLVHYSVPHGLEQYGGAAWGTRDVCQGPSEFFLATGKDEQVRDILRTVYSHQYEDDGNWPQWFMFDNYARIQQEESHGDIIVWPLKVLGDYLAATGDVAILRELLPYTRKGTFDFTEARETLLEHVLKQIDYVKSHFLPATRLSSYGDGDWDDTLQPANAQLKKYMVSSWTVALTYQTVSRFARALRGVERELSEELQALAEGIGADFAAYMLPSGVILGFLYMEDPDRAKPMLHPSDEETGIQYRLLPMTRSMIAELLSPEQAEAHYGIIKRELHSPDGVRLMNRPAKYAGGVSRYFKRAEQSANFGREIGLQYVHAHIRYIEAMAKLGKRGEVWTGLEAINPVGIRQAVPNAELRQANAYFSSSDGSFKDRYEAERRFEELRTGSVAVKGGWRIYSSGPGIYMNQLIANALGVRREDGDLVLDPVLPETLDGMRFFFRYEQTPCVFVYRLSGSDSIRRVTVNGLDVSAVPTSNRYRPGGARIKREDFRRLLRDGLNVVEIFR